MCDPNLFELFLDAGLSANKLIDFWFQLNDQNISRPDVFKNLIKCVELLLDRGLLDVEVKSDVDADAFLQRGILTRGLRNEDYILLLKCNNTMEKLSAILIFIKHHKKIDTDVEQNLMEDILRKAIIHHNYKPSKLILCWFASIFEPQFLIELFSYDLFPDEPTMQLIYLFRLFIWREEKDTHIMILNELAKLDVPSIIANVTDTEFRSIVYHIIYKSEPDTIREFINIGIYRQTPIGESVSLKNLDHDLLAEFGIELSSDLIQ
jgi:hypothetical protein